MSRRLMFAFAFAAVLSAIVWAQPTPLGTPRLIELDVTVRDNDDRPVTDLRKEEIQIKEDGKAVAISSVTRVSIGPKEEGRSLVIILDDAGVPAAGTPVMQTIANLLIAGAGPRDLIAVFPLHGGLSDEPSADHDRALKAVADFHAGVVPWSQTDTTEEFMVEVARLGRRWEKTQTQTQTPRRTAIVCLGSPALCNIIEREPIAPRDMYSNWVEAIRMTARARTLVYGLVPATALGPGALQGGSIIERTGGHMFYGSAVFEPTIHQIYRDLSDYYLVSYPSSVALNKDLHKIDVNVNRKDVKVKTRLQRSN
jgi:VWFA-related protein